MRRLLVTVLAAAALPAVSLAQHAHAPTEAKTPAAARATIEEPRVAIDVPAVQQQRIGLQTGRVERRPMRRSIRTVGSVSIDERREAHVHTRYDGWIEEIRASYVGQLVKKGETLCSFYSPELVAIQEEFLAAKGGAGVAGEVARSALERLRLLGVPASEVGRLERGEKRKLLVPIVSPIDGYVVEKTAVQGMYVTPDMHLYRIADLADVWIVATLYEYDLPLVKAGDEAEVTLTYEPERRFRGRITYVYPDVSLETRTVRARLEVENAGLSLKPGMYVNVAIEKDLGEVLTVPEASLIDTGVRKIVFVRTRDSRFEPREVEVEGKAEGSYAVRSGLAVGDEVVTSANFLIDAESRLQAAIQKGIGGPADHSGHGSR